MKKILAIDDSEINLELIGQICKLHYSGFKYLKALNGKRGIELAKKENPEIILLDIIMPEINGFEVCEILKKDKATQNIPIIMISALGQNSSERTKGLNAGADAFISKPFNQNELRAQINVALRIKKVEDLLRTQNKSLELLIKDQTTKHLQSEERFLQISEHAREFYWEIDLSGIFTYVSPVIEKTILIKPESIIGEKNYRELFQLKNDKNTINASFEQKKSFNDFEIELVLSNYKKIWLAVSGFSIFDNKKEFFGMRGVCYDITKRKQAELALKRNVIQIQNYQQKLKSLNTEITLVEERERRRIAENLHDSLGQTLSLAYMKLSSIVDIDHSDHVKNVIEGTSDLLDKAIAESRSLTYDLSPPILYELGLVPAIKWKLGQISEKHNIQTLINDDKVKINLSKEYNIFIYRIICELLTNTIKHAQAELIEINIQKGEKFYYITIQDNGSGFDTEKEKKATKKGGFGLLSITERLDNIKGKFKLESKLGEGTKANIEIPFTEVK